MKKSTRRLIFWIFVAIFLLSTPPTILYAIGYSFDWQNHILVKTGAIYLKSTPANAVISINGESRYITPQLVPHLLPGDYSVIVQKTGFYPWEKKLNVQAGLVTEARNIFLFPTDITPQLVAKNVTSTIEYFLSDQTQRTVTRDAAQLASSTIGWLLNNENIFYVQKDSFIVYRTDLSGLIKEQLSREPLPPSDTYRIFANPNGQLAALSQEMDLYLLDRQPGAFNKIASQIKNVRFTSDNKKIIFWNDNEIWVMYLTDILLQPYKKSG